MVDISAKPVQLRAAVARAIAPVSPRYPPSGLRHWRQCASVVSFPDTHFAAPWRSASNASRTKSADVQPFVAYATKGCTSVRELHEFLPGPLKTRKRRRHRRTSREVRWTRNSSLPRMPKRERKSFPSSRPQVRSVRTLISPSERFRKNSRVCRVRPEPGVRKGRSRNHKDDVWEEGRVRSRFAGETSDS